MPFVGSFPIFVWKLIKVIFQLLWLNMEICCILMFFRKLNGQMREESCRPYVVPIYPELSKKQIVFCFCSAFIWNLSVLPAYFKTLWNFFSDSTLYHFCVSLISVCNIKKKQRKKVICWDNQESERTKEPSKLLASVLIHPYSVPDGPVPLCDHCDTFSSLLPSYAASHFFVCLFVSIGKHRKEV